MKIYHNYGSYEKEDFMENMRFSCHGWIRKCVEDIGSTSVFVEKNKDYLNEKDLVGKFNSLNYLLDFFMYHQSIRYRNYPSNRNPKIDFLIISYFLIINSADVNSIDYQRHSFLENLALAKKSEIDNQWKQKYSFLDEQILFVCLNENKKDILSSILVKESLDSYFKLKLEFSLKDNFKKDKLIKI